VFLCIEFTTSIRSLCHGKYTVLAPPPEAPEHSFWDLDFVSKHERFGTPIELNSGDRKTVQPVAIVLQDD